MNVQASAEIYMIKKSAEGLVVSFRLGTDHGVKPGLRLDLLNEGGFRLGEVEVLASTETESEALAHGEAGIQLGCRVSRPHAFSSV